VLAEPEGLDLGDEELSNALAEGMLDLADADGSGPLAEAEQDELLGEEVRLGPASSTVGPFVSGWGDEVAEGYGDVNLQDG